MNREATGGQPPGGVSAGGGWGADATAPGRHDGGRDSDGPPVTWLKACLNGGRSRAEHEAVPVTPEELALAAKSVAAMGVPAVHVHPRGADGRESLHPEDIEAAVDAIRAAVPELKVGVTTRAEACPDRAMRLRLVESWPAPDRGGPDFASVNWHEPGAADVAAALWFNGIGVEAGLFTKEAARAFASVPREGVERVLVEAVPGMGPGGDGVTVAKQVLAELAASRTADVLRGIPTLVHGEEHWAWPVLHWARVEGYAVRIGLEDTLARPDGHRARDNADLVRIVLGRREVVEGEYLALSDGLRMYYEVHGEGPPVVLLHGEALTVELCWSSLLPTLAQRHRVIAVELQGHGHTPDREGGFDLARLASDVAELLAFLGLDRADVVGFSLGGLVALTLAVDHPRLVDRLVLASTPWHGRRQVFTGKLGELVARHCGWSPDQVGSVAAPTLVVVGDTDTAAVHDALRMAELMPAASLAVLPATRHTEVTHRADLLLPMLASFLRPPEHPARTHLPLRG
ncbi:MAG TPA: alpha/beta fold hydrolase [Dermatophilaceae bacterium]|nr:alpha/beta fold hydrolase [Dermatophilaceae bacterium]